jgi:hypothetical protein
MLNNARLAIRFWGEALSYYAQLLNMCPSAAIPANTTPYKMANKRKLDYSTLRVFGCRAWVHVRKDKRKSLEPHAKPCVFLGIPDDFKGWKLWDPLAQGGRGGVIISRDVVWNEEEFPGTFKTALDPILASFGRPADAEPVPDAPEHEEMEDDSGNAGGAWRRLPGTFNVGLDSGRAGDSSAASLLSLSSNLCHPTLRTLNLLPRSYRLRRTRRRIPLFALLCPQRCAPLAGRLRPQLVIAVLQRLRPRPHPLRLHQSCVAARTLEQVSLSIPLAPQRSICTRDACLPFAFPHTASRACALRLRSLPMPPLLPFPTLRRSLTMRRGPQELPLSLIWTSIRSTRLPHLWTSSTSWVVLMLPTLHMWFDAGKACKRS